MKSVWYDNLARLLAAGVLGAAGLAVTEGCSTAHGIKAEEVGVVTERCEGCRVQRVAACGGFLEGPVIDSDGIIWVLDVMSGRILRVGPDGTCIERGRPGDLPTGAKMAPDGTITVAANSGLYSFNPTDGQTTKIRFMFQGEDLTGLNDLSYDRAGGLYVTVPGLSSAINPSGRVFYRAATGDVNLLASNLAYPNGIAVAPDQETVLVAEFAAKRILSLPSVLGRRKLRMAFVVAHTEGGIGPDGLGFDARGRLLVANFGAGTLAVVEGTDNRRSAIALGAQAGMMVTNLVVNGPEVFVTEAENGEIWRVQVLQ